MRLRAVGIALLLVACQTVHLRTVTPNPNLACGQALIAPFRVAVDLTREDPVWGVFEDGKIVNLLWPPGFSLRTTPELAVVDHTGKVVAKPGQVMSDAGGEPGPPAIICSIGGVDYPLNRAP